MRILFVTGRFPRPSPGGDQTRAYHQLRLLSRSHRITLVTGSDADVPAEGRRIVAGFCDEVFPVPRPALAIAGGLWRGLASGRPLQTALYDTTALRRTLDRLLGERRHDVVHVQLARLAAPSERGAPIPRVLDLVDALSLNMDRRQRRSRGLMAWAAGLERRRLQPYERMLCASWEASTVVSEADRRAIGDFPRLAVNPNGVDLGMFPFHEGPREALRVVFTGHLRYFPNVDGAAWFVEQVWPHVRRALPGVTLELAGANPTRRVERLAEENEDVRLAAFVPEMHPHLARAQVAVAPLHSGSGQPLKIFEAMASGTPVVATSLALSGLEIEPGRHALVAETAEVFAGEVVRLLQDAGLGRRIALEARRLVESRYTWERSVQDLERIYQSVMA
jgi:glycosyltransferase involved in cell wall biosynthesis